MPNLQVFHVGKIIRGYDFENELTPRYVTTPYLTKILTRLMDAAPAMESLTFGHGKHGHVSKKKLRQGRLIIPPLPTFELGMLPMPPTLTNLSLEYVLVEPNEFLGLDIGSFDRIQFRHCGPNAVETAQVLHKKFPSFNMSVSEDGDTVGLSRFG